MAARGVKWVGGAAAVAAFLGLGVYFAVVGLDRADKTASVLGAFVGLLALALTAYGFVKDRRPAQPSPAETEAEALARARWDAECQQRHAELRPPPPPYIEASREHGALFGSITVPRDYRVTARAYTSDTASQPISLSLLLRENRPEKFYIEPWLDGQQEPRTKEIAFEFWPPVPGADDADPWSCPCEGSTRADTSGTGHWRWRVPVRYSGLEQQPLGQWR